MVAPPRLSVSVLRRVAAMMDQSSRVACCMACKALEEALRHPAAWPRATVYKPDGIAEEYVSSVGVKELHIVWNDARDVERFLDSLASRGMHSTITSLRLSMGHANFGRASTLLHSISDFAALVDLNIECEDVPQPACLAFPRGQFAGLQRLHSLRVAEHASNDGTRKLEVYFDDARLPSLAEINIRVATSDIVAQVHRLPALRVLNYWCERETYEDASLDGARLTLLAVNALSPNSLDYLMCALSRARQVDTLLVRCFADVSLQTYIPIENLHVKLFDPASEVTIVHPVVRCLESVTIEHSGDGIKDWTVRFVSTGSWHNFERWLKRTDFIVGLDGAVKVIP